MPLFEGAWAQKWAQNCRVTPRVTQSAIGSLFRSRESVLSAFGDCSVIDAGTCGGLLGWPVRSAKLPVLEAGRLPAAKRISASRLDRRVDMSLTLRSEEHTSEL